MSTPNLLAAERLAEIWMLSPMSMSPACSLALSDLRGHIDALEALGRELAEAADSVRVGTVGPFVTRINGAKRMADALQKARGAGWL